MTSNGPSVNTGVGFLENDDSLLTRKFGKETVNYYSGSNLNRYSFLRPDHVFLRNAFLSAKARFMALDNLNPLVNNDGQISWLGLEDVEILIGSHLYEISEEETIKQFNSTKFYPLVLFLGLWEHGLASVEQFATSEHGTVKGLPFFAIDVTAKGADSESSAAFLEKQKEQGRVIQTNPRAMTLKPDGGQNPAPSFLHTRLLTNSPAAIYAQARSMIDWNTRNSFCAGCGNPNLAVHAGYKRVCPPADASAKTTRGDCPTRHGISNVCFPRTDPTMIAAVVSADGQRVLLGRQKRYPPDWYSTLAGFLEPGESIEESVRREVWEESGVKVGRVVIHSSQPWPYPSSLMIGAVAQALPGGEDIDLQDRELEAAKWFTLDEVDTALKTTTSALNGELAKDYVEGALRLPPAQAIANRLLTAVVDGFLTCTAKI